MNEFSNRYTENIDLEEFAGVFGIDSEAFPENAKSVIASEDFRYRILFEDERDDAFLRVVKFLTSELPKERISGAHRKEVWERGWSENLDNFTKSGFDTKELLPKFVRKKELIRYKGNYIDPASADFETNFVKVLRYYLFNKYFSDSVDIYEFGFGAGLNMVALAEMFPDKKLYGLDWANASKEIAEKLSEELGINLSGFVFDIFSPDETFKIAPGAAVFSIGTMEQIGKDFKPFVEYLIKQRPNICINIETLYEVYDENSLFDYVASAYLEKRNYLRGYLDFLRELESDGRIEILDVRRTFGSFYHDGYTYVVWKPI